MLGRMSRVIPYLALGTLGILSMSRLCHYFLLLSLAASVGACAPLHVVQKSSDPANTEAILVLPGLGMKRSALDGVREFGSTADEAGLDLFVADFRSRRSIEAGVDALHGYLEELDLDGYEKVHVFAYILGGYTFNRFLEKYPMTNLGSVVYDRSPLQELAPELATKGWFSVLTWIAVGPVVADLAATPYQPIPVSDDRSVGLIIENRATKFVRKRRKRALAIRPLTFEPDSLGQSHADVLHVRFNHDEMYTNFDVIGPELLHFFRFGEFSMGARREPLGIDPFTKE
jgi:pimeloyl-ACP methyl ester carboxylesterase